MDANVDQNRVNDMQYMKNQIMWKSKNVCLLGEELKNNKSFIIEMVGNKRFRFHWALLKNMDKDLREDIDFVTFCIRLIVNTGKKDKKTFEKIFEIIPKEKVRHNKEFWNTMTELGIVEVDYNPNISPVEKAARTRKRKLENIISNIEQATVEQFLKVTNADQRNNPEIMLKVLSRNEALYVCLDERLKRNEEFSQKLISKNTSIEDIINGETRKREEEKQRKETEKEQRKREREKRKEEKLQKEKDELIKKYQKRGEKYQNLILVKKFLISNMSKKTFARKNNITEEKLEEFIKEVSIVYPEIAERLEKRSEKMSAMHVSRMHEIDRKLLLGEISLKQYVRDNFHGNRISELLSVITDKNDRINMHKLIMQSIASKELTMMDIAKLFSDGTGLEYQTVINSINKYMTMAGNEIAELKGAPELVRLARTYIGSLSKYSRPFKDKDFINAQKGVIDKDGNINMTTINEQDIRYALKYLRITNEYICYATVNKVILELLKGDITFESIDNMAKNSKYNIAEVEVVISDRTTQGVKSTLVQINSVAEKNISSINTLDASGQDDETEL